VSPRAGSSAAAARREAKSRGALIAAYREGLGLAAIVAVHESAGIRIVAIGELDANATPRPQGAIAARWWCRHAKDAERVAAAATARFQRRKSQDESAHPSPGAPVPAEDGLSAAVEAAAKRLRIALYSDDEICADADGIIARVEEEIENLKSAGQLKSVNQSYRAYRLETSAGGEKAAPYADWLNKYKANLVRELAAALRYA
jgi:hypothetical protein